MTYGFVIRRCAEYEFKLLLIVLIEIGPDIFLLRQARRKPTNSRERCGDIHLRNPEDTGVSTQCNIHGEIAWGDSFVAIRRLKIGMRSNDSNLRLVTWRLLYRNWPAL